MLGERESRARQGEGQGRVKVEDAEGRVSVGAWSRQGFPRTVKA